MDADLQVVYVGLGNVVIGCPGCRRNWVVCAEDLMAACMAFRPIDLGWPHTVKARPASLLEESHGNGRRPA